MKDVRCTFRVTKRLLEKIDEELEKGLFMNRSDFLRSAILDYLVLLKTKEVNEK